LSSNRNIFILKISFSAMRNLVKITIIGPPVYGFLMTIYLFLGRFSGIDFIQV